MEIKLFRWLQWWFEQDKYSPDHLVFRVSLIFRDFYVKSDIIFILDNTISQEIVLSRVDFYLKIRASFIANTLDRDGIETIRGLIADLFVFDENGEPSGETIKLEEMIDFLGKKS